MKTIKLSVNGNGLWDSDERGEEVPIEEAALMSLTNRAREEIGRGGEQG